MTDPDVTDELLRRSTRKFVWLEEYKHCGCSNVTETRREAIGYCPRHANGRRIITKVPNNGMELGYTGSG